MITTPVPSKCRCSAVKVPLIVPLKSGRFRRSTVCSAISAVELRVPPLHARDVFNLKNQALMALPTPAPPMTCENASAINGTAMALTHGDRR